MNTLLFKSAASPGLAKVLLTLFDFEGSAIRRRVAKNLRGGPHNEYEACVGKTFGEIQHQYDNANFIGIVRPGVKSEDMQREGLGEKKYSLVFAK